MRYRAICFGDRADEEATVVTFSELRELESPVRADGYGIRGWRYSTMDALYNAKTLNELEELSE